MAAGCAPWVPTITFTPAVTHLNPIIFNDTHFVPAESQQRRTGEKKASGYVNSFPSLGYRMLMQHQLVTLTNRLEAEG